MWRYDATRESSLAAPVKAHLREQLGALERSRLLFIRRPERRQATGLALYHARSSEHDAALAGLELEAYEDLLEVDFTVSPLPDVDGPLLLACTHGRRDRCCARYGQPLYRALRDAPEAARAWQSSHVGGDRFAGNLVVLPEGLYYGRVGRADVRPLLDGYADGRIHLERFRGRACFPPAVQAAEHHLRSHTGLEGIAALTLERVEALEGRWRVRFREAASGRPHEVDVAARAEEPQYLTCDASTPQRPRRYVVTARPPRR